MNLENNSMPCEILQLESRIAKLEEEIQTLQARNARVEIEKSWETSRTRILLVLMLTYSCMVLTFYVLDQPRIWANAVIPSLGFFLSTQSLPFFRTRWHVNHDLKAPH